MNSGNRSLLLIGNITWILGTLVAVGFVVFFVVSGGWGMLIFYSPLGLLLPAAIIAIAVGRYLVTKAKS